MWKRTRRRTEALADKSPEAIAMASGSFILLYVLCMPYLVRFSRSQIERMPGLCSLQM